MHKALAIAVLAGAPGVLLAEEAASYPSRTVRVVVPYAPGGFADVVMRLVGHKLSAALGKQFVIDNRPGAGGIVAAQLVAKAAPDGYMLLAADSQQFAINPAMRATLPYDFAKDFVPVSLAASSPLFLAAHSSLPASGFPQLVSLARSKPGSINYGSSGPGSIHHLSMESLKASLGINLVHVPYKGSGQSVPALVSGQVSLVLSTLPPLTAHMKAGSVRLLAVNTAKRSKLAPDVPAIAELGVPGFDFPATTGFVAPTGTPQDIVAKLAAEVSKAVHQPDLVEKFTSIGIEPVGSSPAEFAQYIREEAEKYAKAVKVSGAKAE